MPLWAVWVVLGIILLIIEVLTPEFIVGSFAVGCFITAAAAYFTNNLNVHLFIFTVTTVLVLWKIRPVFLNYLDSEQAVSNVDLLKGRTGLVLSPVGPGQKKGRVQVGGEDWSAVSEDGEKIEDGERVKIVDISSVKLVVKKEEGSRAL